MSVNVSYPILYEAYEHYQKTGERHFHVVPKNPNYLLNILSTIPYLSENGYIENVSDNLLVYSSLNIIPPEDMSFDITFNGILFIESQRE